MPFTNKGKADERAVFPNAGAAPAVIYMINPGQLQIIFGLDLFLLFNRQGLKGLSV